MNSSLSVTPPEFTGKAAESLAAYYTPLGVQTVLEKIAALQANLGHFDVGFYGVQRPSPEMVLRAAERVFLFKRNIPVEEPKTFDLFQGA